MLALQYRQRPNIPFSIYQMSILEVHNVGDGTPQGVILALVGPAIGCSRDHEAMRTLRMYNLASLISLAKWSIAQKVCTVIMTAGHPLIEHLQGARPVVLHRQMNSQSTPTKRHRAQGSITKGFRNLVVESPVAATPSTPYSRLMPPEVTSGNRTPESPSSEPGWDVIDDLPMRWATDFIPLATPGSRLMSTSANFYDIWHEGGVQGRGSALLAIATKSNILLYEKPKGERAFRFVKVSDFVHTICHDVAYLSARNSTHLCNQGS